MVRDATTVQLAIVVAQCVSCLLLTGLALVVQVVVYPGLITAGRAAPQVWRAIHDDHSRRITRAVGLPWLVQGITCAALLLDRPPRTALWEALLTGALGALTVALTLAWAIPLHQRLGDSYDDAAARQLLRANAARLLVWAAAGGLALDLVLTV